MKAIEELGAQAIKRRLKAIYALPQGTLTQAQLDERTALEARQWALHVEQHPPVHTPANFIEEKEEW